MTRQLTRTACRPLLVILTAILAITVAGCDEHFVSALHPYFDQQGLNTDGALPGTWVYKEENSQEQVRFIFTVHDDQTYDVVVEENDDGKRTSSRFEGHLFRLGADSFLDLLPSSEPAESAFYVLHLVRCHSVARVEFRQSDLQLTFLNAGWLSQQMKEGAVSVPHKSVDDVLLLTGSTLELQEFLSANSSDDAAFSDPILFERARHDEEAQ
jgi:hypothetical protein